MGESEAKEAPLHFCAEHGGSILQDLGGAAVQGLRKRVSALGLQLLHSQALGQRMVPEHTRGSQGSPRGL